MGKQGFAAHPELAKKWGRINGKKYKRGKNKKALDQSQNNQYPENVNKEQM